MAEIDLDPGGVVELCACIYSIAKTGSPDNIIVICQGAIPAQLAC